MRTRDAPWWLVGGMEWCPFCLQRYALEVEVRCAGCDRGFCTHCVARVEAHEEIWCPECATADAPSAGGRRGR